MFCASTVLSPLRMNNLTAPSDLKQWKETGLMLWGHSAFEWTPVPQHQLTACTSKHHSHKTSSTMSSLSSLSSLASLPQLDDSRLDVDDHDDMDGLQCYPRVAGVSRMANKVLEWDLESKPTPPTPAMLPSLLPDVAPAYEHTQEV
ncbi:hypothetical protein B0H21DRAFT_820238 [Amylocystis lapponica]|nr:hypothetical protein B0H21DRAFT_820238 [Amylocystis lapponica]